MEVLVLRDAILDLKINGMTNNQIASFLKLSESDVRYHSTEMHREKYLHNTDDKILEKIALCEARLMEMYSVNRELIECDRSSIDEKAKLEPIQRQLILDLFKLSTDAKKIMRLIASSDYINITPGSQEHDASNNNTLESKEDPVSTISGSREDVRERSIRDNQQDELSSSGRPSPKVNPEAVFS